MMTPEQVNKLLEYLDEYIDARIDFKDDNNHEGTWLNMTRKRAALFECIISITEKKNEI